MVTYDELFQFCMLVIALVGLVYKICNKKESLATLSRPSGMRSIYFISARCASLRSILCDRNFLSHKNNRPASKLAVILVICC